MLGFLNTLQNSLNTLTNTVERLDKDGRDYFFYAQLEEHMQTLSTFETSNKNAPLPLHLLNKIYSACVRFSDNPLDTYVKDTIKPAIKALLDDRKKEINNEVCEIFNAIFLSGSSEKYAGLIAKEEENFRLLNSPQSEDKKKPWIFHRVCENLYGNCAHNRQIVFMSLIKLTKKAQKNKPLIANQGNDPMEKTEQKLRKALLDPYRPIRHPGGDYKHVIAPLRERFARLNVQPTSSPFLTSSINGDLELDPEKRSSLRNY